MSASEFSIVGSSETVFFGSHNGELCQWITVTIGNDTGSAAEGSVTIQAGGKEVVTVLRVEPGIRDYRCYAPVLWPDHPPETQAPLRLTVDGSVCAAAVGVGHRRPWTVYLLSDVCTDYAWLYSDEAALRADDADLTEAEMVQAEATRDLAEPNCNRYNLVHSREIEFYLERYPDRAERLWDHIRRGSITLNPFFNMCLTGNMSLEELVRHLYPAREAAVRHGLELAYANHQETPTITWAMATVLAGCGVNHLVKSILQVECPWAARLEEPPVFVWEGPDGSRILVRRNNRTYVEGNFVMRGVHRINPNLHGRILPAYEELGGAYPFDAVALVGCYGDLQPHTKDLPAQKVRGVAAYNAQEWEYPLLVNASHKQFWDHIEARITAGGIELPVHRGDYGASWEVWPACLAHDFAGWRRAQELAGAADRLAAIISRVDRGCYEAHRPTLARGWSNLSYLSDHAWNGSGDANLEFNKSVRRTWQQAANEALDSCIAAGLSGLARRIPAGRGNRVAVFNGLGWRRSGIARLPGVAGAPTVTDVATARPVPSQVVEEDGRRVLCFEARNVGSVGYRTFEVSSGGSSERGRAQVTCDGDRLDGPFYALELSPVTGGIMRLFDKVRGRELVDADSPHHLNQCLHYSHDVEHAPTRAVIEAGPCGPVLGRLVARAWLKNTEVTSRVTLYASLDRVDICNQVQKRITTEPQEMDFAFPFAVPDHEYRCEAPGAIIEPGKDHRPGAGLAVLAVRHFVDVFNREFGVTLSQADSGMVQFGHRTSREDPQSPDMRRSTVLALAMQNCFDKTEAVLDQGGVSRFTFRYSLCGHAGGFDPAGAVRFGWEDNNALLAVRLDGGAAGDLSPDALSFLEVSPENVVLSCFKVAEEEGLIVRLWECAERETQAVVRPMGLGVLVAAQQTDLLERDVRPLSVADGQVVVPLRARGLAAARLVFA